MNEDYDKHCQAHELSEEFYNKLKEYLVDNLDEALHYLKECSKILQEKLKENNDANEVSEFVFTKTGDIYCPDFQQLRCFKKTVIEIPCLVTSDEKWYCHYACGAIGYTNADGEQHSQYPASDSDDDMTPEPSQKAKSEPSTPLIDPDRCLTYSESYKYCCMEYDINEKDWEGPDYYDDCFEALGVAGKKEQQKEIMKHCKRTRREFKAKEHELRITRFKHINTVRRPQTQQDSEDE